MTSKKIFKVRMCSFHLDSACLRGDNCTYAHCQEELREQPNLFKTQICDNWKKGKCKNQNESSLCKYAHGIDELNSNQNVQIEESTQETDSKCSVEHLLESKLTSPIIKPINTKFPSTSTLVRPIRYYNLQNDQERIQEFSKLFQLCCNTYKTPITTYYQD